MAQPASPFFPPSDSTLLIVRELKGHVDVFARQLSSALQNLELTQQGTFLRDFSQNIKALDKLLKSIVFNEMNPDARSGIEEIAGILTHVLAMTVDTEKGIAMTVLNAVKNYSTPSTRESDLSHFLGSLVQYPESSRILIQELHLISQDLEKYL